jgi:hypothetical protein
VLRGNRIEVGLTRMVPYRIRLPRSKRHALQDYKIESADEDVNMQSQDTKEGELNGGRDAVGSSGTGSNVRLTWYMY